MKTSSRQLQSTLITLPNRIFSTYMGKLTRSTTLRMRKLSLSFAISSLRASPSLSAVITISARLSWYAMTCVTETCWSIMRRI